MPSGPNGQLGVAGTILATAEKLSVLSAGLQSVKTEVQRLPGQSEPTVNGIEEAQQIAQRLHEKLVSVSAYLVSWWQMEREATDAGTLNGQG